MDLPNTETRVSQHTDQEVNLCLLRELKARVFYFAQHSDQITARLAELDREWDIERILEANAAGVSLVGIALASRNRKWLILPFAVAGFLLQHALQGWCPPVEVFRRLGVRTTAEIHAERTALKALRGDFQFSFSHEDGPEQRAGKVLQHLGLEDDGPKVRTATAAHKHKHH